MKFISDTRVHLTADEAQALSVQTLEKIGYDAEEARIIANHVVDAALCGYEYSGLPKILNVAEHKQLKLPRRRIRQCPDRVEGSSCISPNEVLPPPRLPPRSPLVMEDT